MSTRALISLADNLDIFVRKFITNNVQFGIKMTLNTYKIGLTI